ncbi:MAG: NADPH-dependent glutamate synthase [Acholeplasmataceae bacterium]|nr:NADPH-dependent glutamate synthase [Acholeplasmataceae bacterium]
MFNKSLVKNIMPLQDPLKRIENFDEVSLGYTLEQAIDEAKRCLDCKHKPCVNGCPVEIDIPLFIEKIGEGLIEEAYQIILQSSSLPSVCGRVCPQETQCEEVCVRGIKGEAVAIGRLERFVADYHHRNSNQKPNKPESNHHKIAIVGSGPSGLSCAYDLALLGYEVTMFEALHIPGGVLVYGIPEFRLPKEIVRKEIQTLVDLGVNIETNVIIGKTLSIEDLFEDGFEAIFLGTGAGLPKFMNIPGEMLNGVYSANEFLTRVNLMQAYHQSSSTPIQMAQRVAVIGGGNVAVDAARCAKRLGAKEVSIVYRRSMKELPARLEEIEHAEEEGIIFRLLSNPVQIIGNDQGFVKSIECVEMELGEPDQSGRQRPIVKKGSEFIIEVDSVIMAIGTTPNPLITSTTPGLETDRWGCIITKDDSGLTSKEMVYAGGDVVTGAATVILAMGAGRKSAAAIDQKLRAIK